MSHEPSSSSSERADLLVKCTATASAREAHELAARLRGHGIVALANAEPLPRRRSDRGILLPEEYQAFVVVLRADLDRARALLEGEMVAEGPTPRSEIERELREADDDDLDEDDDDEPSPLQAFGDWTELWTARIGKAVLVLIVVIAAGAIVVACFRK